ncbi:hypothetical protein FEM48_Zijuj06G0135600 [Ziziphus jujuba var. spinosa]|uniref:Uncharacterized protein n=1 Tax=Ziziphus jujuba var. spinosa TaxID=714518 RepID=A0A978V9K5_ZIZJJ|nr:hypothetical protein FEM48_Zijuj06G0135600 [Ziziphus jujuba var. spinosa]
MSRSSIGSGGKICRSGEGPSSGENKDRRGVDFDGFPTEPVNGSVSLTGSANSQDVRVEKVDELSNPTWAVLDQVVRILSCTPCEYSSSIYLTACFAEVNIDIVRLIHAFLWVTIWNSYYIDGDILRIAVLLLVQPSKMTHYITLLMSTILMWSLQSFNRVKGVDGNSNEILGAACGRFWANRAARLLPMHRSAKGHSFGIAGGASMLVVDVGVNGHFNRELQRHEWRFPANSSYKAAMVSQFMLVRLFICGGPVDVLLV